MTGTVERLHLIFDSNTYIDEDDFSILFARISSYMPNIQVLYLEGPSIETRQDHSLSVLVIKLRLLRKVVLPSQFVPEMTFEALAFCPSLEEILVDTTRRVGLNVHSQDVVESLRTEVLLFPSRGFQRIRVLSLCFLSIESAILSIISTHFPSETVIHLRLYIAYFHSVQVDSSLGVLAGAIGSQCPHLVELYIGFVPLRFMHGFARVHEPNHLKFSDISNFFDLPFLSSFHLDYPKVVEMWDGAVDYIARMGDRLRHLWITPWPHYPFAYDILPLSSIGRLSRRCPNIQSLGLCVDASLPSGHLGDVSVMRHLHSLTLGRSPLSVPYHETPSYEHWASVARYLASIIPVRTPLIVQDNFRDGSLSTVESEESTSGEDDMVKGEGGWKLVTSAVRVIQQVDEENFEELYRMERNMKVLEAAILDMHA